VSVGEADAFAGESVEIGRRDFGFGVKAADVAVAEVVGEDVDDVGVRRVGGGGDCEWNRC